ncbi:MAG: ABC transporter substrate-binding protein [Bacteroidota bacterium]
MHGYLHRRPLPVLLASAGLLLALTSGQPASAAAKTRISVLASTSQWFYGYLKEQIDAFQAQHPDVSIALEGVPGSPVDPLMVRAAAGLTPDVMFLGNVSDRLIRDVLEKLALDVGPILERDQDVTTRSFYPTIIRAFTHNQQLVGIPLGVFTSATFVNKRLFDESGIPVPDEAWTWNDLLSIGTKLTKRNPTNQQAIQWGFGADGSSLVYLGASSFLWANDADVVDQNESRATINETRAIQALQFFYDIHFKHNIAYTPPQAGQWTAFWNGKLAIWESASWNIAFNRQHARKDVDWDIVPQLRSPYTNKAASLISSNVIAISRTSRHPDLAWEFIKYAILSKQGQERIAQEGVLPPIVGAVSYYLNTMKAPPSNVKQVVQSVAYGRTAVWFSDPAINKTIWDYLEQRWDQVMQQKTSVESFAAEAAAFINSVLKR